MAAPLFNCPFKARHLTGHLAFDRDRFGDDLGPGRLPELIPEAATVIMAMVFPTNTAGAGQYDILAFRIPADLGFFLHHWLGHRHSPDALAAAAAVAMAVTVIRYLLRFFCHHDGRQQNAHCQQD